MDDNEGLLEATQELRVSRGFIAAKALVSAGNIKCPGNNKLAKNTVNMEL